jgi:histidyl-tRNA synthetase
VAGQLERGKSKRQPYREQDHQQADDDDRASGQAGIIGRRVRAIGTLPAMVSGQIAAPRGTRDLLPEEGPAWERLEAVARDLSHRYAFDRVDTPLFERVELFARGLGESSDAVEKEMFRVAGAAGSEEERAEWALRPEPTAGIVRAYVEHGMHVRPGPLRLWMLGPMFRYDRPQAGRYRQFTQWDVEVIGDPGPMVDAELMELAHRYFAQAGIHDVVAHLNSIGDATCRPVYRQALIDYFAPHEARLTDDSRRRLRVNPLRVLDDKKLDPELADRAPRALDHLCDPCEQHFRGLLSLLDELGLRYVIDHRLVRGLDYYTRTTFEFYVAGREGQQQSLVGGGRLDGLVELLGGRPTPAIGFGLGIDRALLAAQDQGVALEPSVSRVAIVSADPDALSARLRVAVTLRDAGLAVRPDGSSRKLGRQLESAAKAGARWAVILGEELELGSVILRDLEAGEQREVALSEVAENIR